MTINRRQFLNGLLGLVGLGVAAELKGYGPISRLDHSLATVLSEPNGIFYEGFPSRLNKSGFSVREGSLAVKGTPKELLIFGEEHNYTVRRQEEHLFRFLVETHGFDSVGVEGLWGSPSPTLEQDCQKDIAEFFEGKHIIEDRSTKVFEGFSDKWRYKKTPIMDIEISDIFKPYLRQESVPGFGIENKTLLLKSLALLGLDRCMSYVRKSSKVQYRTGLLRVHMATIPYSEIPNIDQVEAFVDLVKEKFPDIPMPGNSLEEMAKNQKENNETYARFTQYIAEEAIQKRSNAMAQNITEHLIRYKKPIIVVGHGHTVVNSEDQKQHPGLKNMRFKPLQEMLPYTNAVVDAVLPRRND